MPVHQTTVGNGPCARWNRLPASISVDNGAGWYSRNADCAHLRTDMYCSAPIERTQNGITRMKPRAPEPERAYLRETRFHLGIAQHQLRIIRRGRFPVMHRSQEQTPHIGPGIRFCRRSDISIRAAFQWVIEHQRGGGGLATACCRARNVEPTASLLRAGHRPRR